MGDDLEKYQEEGDPEDWEADFLKHYTQEFGVEGRAARAAGVHPKVVRKRVKESPRFAMLYAHAQQMVDDVLEFEALRRALEPNEKPIYQRGMLVGVVKEWDTKHLEWMLERRMPDKYHLQSRIEFGSDRSGEVKFKLELGDQTPELEESSESDD